MSSIWDLLGAAGAGIGTGILTGNPVAGLGVGLGLYGASRDQSNPALSQAQQQMAALTQQQQQYAQQQQAYLQQQQANVSNAAGQLNQATGNYQNQVGQFQSNVLPNSQNVISPTSSPFYNTLNNQYQQNLTSGNFVPQNVANAIYNSAMQPLQQDTQLMRQQALENANANNLLGSGSLGIQQGLIDQNYQRAATNVANQLVAQNFQTGLSQQQGLMNTMAGLNQQGANQSLNLEQMRQAGVQAGLGADQSALGAQQQLYGNAANLYGQAQSGANAAFGGALQGAQSLYGVGQQQQAVSNAQFQGAGNALMGAAQTAYMPTYLSQYANAMKGSGWSPSSSNYQLPNISMPSSLGGMSGNPASGSSNYFAGSSGPR